MDELFSQLGLVSAILGGFAFTFVGGLLAIDNSKQAYGWVFGASMVAALSFTITALGATLAALAVKNGFPFAVDRQHSLLSITFLLGILALMLSTGLAGWIKNRRLGLLSSLIALLSLLLAVMVISPFLKLG